MDRGMQMGELWKSVRGVLWLYIHEDEATLDEATQRVINLLPAPGEGSPSHPSGPSQDSQEVREGVLRLIDALLDEGLLVCEGKRKDLDKRILALLSQSPKGAAGAGLEALEKEIVSAACLEYSTRNNGDYAPRRALHEAVRTYLAAPSPTTAGAAGASTGLSDDLANALARFQAEQFQAVPPLKASVEAVAPSAPKTGLRGAPRQSCPRCDSRLNRKGEKLVCDNLGCQFWVHLPEAPKAPLSEAKGPDLPPSSQPAPGDVGEAGGAA